MGAVLKPILRAVAGRAFLTAWLSALVWGMDASASETQVTKGGNVASDVETDTATLDDDRNAAVVTASGVEEQRAIASANVTAVSWEDISQRGYHSLGEILSDVPGLYVVDDYVLPSMGVRGVTGGFRAGTRIVKIMINGVPVSFRPDLSAFLGPEYIPVEMIERVEIAKGPLSALYGANAFLATVNVITRGQGGGATVIAEATGRANLARASVGYGGTLVGGFDEGGKSLVVAATSERVDRSGLSISRTFPDQDPTLVRYRPYFGGASQNDIAAPTGVFAQFRAKLGASDTILAQGGFQRLDSKGEFQLSSVLTHKSRVSLQNIWTSLRHERKWSDTVSTAIWAGYSRGDPTGDELLFLTASNTSAFTRNFRYQAIDGAIELMVSPFSRLTVKGGFDLSYEPQEALHYTQVYYAPQGTISSGDRQELISPTDTRNFTLINPGVYLQATSNPWAAGALSGLYLTANARVDLPNLFPAQYSWRAALAYKWSESFTTKVIAGRAFQTPSGTLLYGLPGFGSNNNVIGNRTREGAPPLNPQVVHSVELIASLQVLGRLAFEGGAFAQEVTNRIEFAQAGPHFQARNSGQQRNIGMELRGRFVYGRFSLQASGTLERPIIDNLIDSSAQALYPNATVTGRFNLALPEVFLNLNGQARWVGERGASQSNIALNNDEQYTLPSYFTADASISTVGLNFLGGAQTAIALTVKNLTDTRYSEPGFGGFDIPNLGRTVALELRQTF
ncbi:MAG: TonB-dependent receptor plug domain-containing protein [Myxococcaceae bacterium]